MAIVYVGGQVASRAGAASTSTITFSLTGGIDTTPRNGDLVIITSVVGSQARNPAQAISGYTALGQLNPTATTYDTSLNVSYKRMGATPDTSFTLPSTGNNADAQSYCVQVFRGVDSATPLDVSVTSATNTGTTRADPPSITPTTAGAWVVVCSGGAGATTSVFTYSGLSGVLTSAGSDTNDSVVGCGYYSGWTSGAYDPAVTSSGDATGTSSWAAYTIALRPAPNAATLTEDFEDALDGGLWSTTATAGSGSVTITGGMGEMTYTATAAGSQSRIYSTQPRYNLVGGSAYIHIAQCLRTTGNAGGIESAFILENFDFAGDYVGFIWYSDGPLYAYSATDYSDASPTEIASDFSTNDTSRATHAWLRVREDSGTIYWDTAPDSGGGTPGTWVNRRTLALSSAGAPLTETRYVIGTYMGNTAAGVPTQALKVDGLNTAATTSGTSAALTGGTATLSRGTMVPVTERATTGGTATVTAGTATPVLSFALTGHSVTASGGAVAPETARALTGASATVSLGATTASFEQALSGHSVTTSGGTIIGEQTFEVDLTGHSLTTTGGTLFPESEKALTGGTATVTGGLPTAAFAQALTGASVAISAGTTVPVTAKGLTGTSVATSGGTVSPATAQALTGTSVTASAGEITTGASYEAALTGLSTTVTGGTIIPEVSAVLTGTSATVTGGTILAAAATGAAPITDHVGSTITDEVGDPLTDTGGAEPETSVSVALTGHSISAYRGTPLVQSTTTEPLTDHVGGTLTDHVGSVITAGTGAVPSDISVALLGQSITTTGGTVAPVHSHALATQTITAAISTPSVTVESNVTLTGLSMTAQRGEVFYGDIYEAVLAGHLMLASAGIPVASPDKWIGLTGHNINATAGNLSALGAPLPTSAGAANAWGSTAFGEIGFGGDNDQIGIELTGHTITVTRGDFVGMPREAALTGHTMTTSAGGLSGFEGAIVLTDLTGQVVTLTVNDLGVRFYTTADIDPTPIAVPLDVTTVDVPVESGSTTVVPIDNTTVVVPVDLQDMEIQE